jgi:hypothetical protein
MYKAVRAHARKGLALPRANRSGEITLSGSRHLNSTLTAAPVLFAHDAVTTSVANTVHSQTPQAGHSPKHSPAIRQTCRRYRTHEFASVYMRTKDWGGMQSCGKCMQCMRAKATLAWRAICAVCALKPQTRAHVACLPRLRQRHSYSRALSSQWEPGP